jgi:GAF domain-containing protein
VFRKAPQFIDNTFTDPRWENMREIAKDFNLCACWSMPIFSPQGNVLGSFALSSFEHRSPSNFHRKLLEIGASVIGILLDRRVAA